MREWLREWGSLIRFLLMVTAIVGLVFGGIVWSVASSPQCHQVYVQTTPVDGKPALERQEVCR